MAKIDEIKEILNTLRFFFSISVGLIVVITSALIVKEQHHLIDIYFWIGSVLDLMLMIGIIFIIKAIKNNTKKIRDL